MVLRLALYAACVIGLPACASIDAEPARDGRQSVPTYAQLSAQTLAPGECGLFVWAADAKKRFILFTQGETQRAVWFNGEADEALSLASKSGEPSYGQWPEQSFIASSGATLALKLSSAEVIETGVRFKSGLLTVVKGEQWDRLVPVVGLASCVDAPS